MAVAGASSALPCSSRVGRCGARDGEAENVAAIHGPRLERLLERLVETPVRRFVYEAFGSVDPEILAGGVELVEKAARTWQIPIEIVREATGPQVDMSKLG